MTRILLALVALAAGCTLYRKHAVVNAMPSVASDKESVCYRLDNLQFAWGAGSTAATAASGAAGGLLAVFDDRTAQYVLAGGSVLMAAIAGTATYLSASYVKKFTRAGCQ